MTVEERLDRIEKKLNELCEIVCFEYKENEKFLSKEKVTQKETHISKDKEIIMLYDVNNSIDNLKDIVKEDDKDLKDKDYIYKEYIKDLVKKVVDYMNLKLKTNYRYTNAKIKTLISSRVREGFVFEDFKYVIDVKYKEWHKTTMEKYLRYDTLFGNKFEIYRNQKANKKDELKELQKIANKTSAKIRGELI